MTPCTSVRTDRPSRRTSRANLLLALALGVALGRDAGAQPKAPEPPRTGIAVIAHPSVPVERLPHAELASIFAGTMKTWRDGSPIRLFNLPAGHPTRTEFDRVVLRMTPEQVSRYWLDRRIRGEGTPPRQVQSPELLSRLVAALAGAVSYVPEDKVGSGVRVVARIRGGQVVAP